MKQLKNYDVERMACLSKKDRTVDITAVIKEREKRELKKNFSKTNQSLIPQNNVYYLAISIKTDKKNKKYIKKHLKEHIIQSLSSWISDQSIVNLEIYSHGKTAEKEGEFTLWDNLILLQLKQEENANKITEDLKNIKLPFMPETIRMELLVTTPESTYPSPGEKAKKRYSKPFYAVEYVDVKEPYLNEFKEIMIKNNGPAMRYIMEHANWCYNFYALETVQVFYHNSSYPTWNQVHVIGLFVDSMLKYKKDFSKALELANHISFEKNFTRLKMIRSMVYKSIGRKLK